jgi:branched-chain amino acid transport system substrate-binding protein
LFVCLGIGTALSQEKTIKLGVISPQSGPVAYFGKGVLRGVEIAVKNANEKGTTGQSTGGLLVGGQRYKVEVVSYDDAADPAKSVAGMRRLVEQHKVTVIVGPLGTPQTWACQEVNVQLGVLFNGGSASDLSRKKGNPLYIQERTPTIYFGIPMAQVAKQRGFNKACVLSDVSEAYTNWGKKFQEEYERIGGKVLGFEVVDTKTTTDYHSIMTNFKGKNPDIIFIVAYEEPTALATSHALDVGYKNKFLFTSEWGAKAEKIVDLKSIEGSLVEAMLHTYYRKYPEEDKRGYLTKFFKQYKEIYNEDIPQPSTTFHDTALLFMRAMEIAGSATDPHAIRAACPEALREGKMPLHYPNNDMLKNGLEVGAPELLLEIKGGQYKLVQEMIVPREVLE